MDDLTRRADELLGAKSAPAANVRARVKAIQDRWDNLNKLRQAKERSLQGASRYVIIGTYLQLNLMIYNYFNFYSVELFHRTCDEAKEWMEEKITKLDTEDLGRDLQTVQALQRRHQNLERELAPLEERVNKINHLAASYVIFYYC